jgi:hypothetical protein
MRSSASPSIILHVRIGAALWLIGYSRWAHIWTVAGQRCFHNPFAAFARIPTPAAGPHTAACKPLLLPNQRTRLCAQQRLDGAIKPVARLTAWEGGLVQHCHLGARL